MTIDSSAIKGVVAEGFDSVRAAFSAVAQEECDDHAAQLVVYLHGRLIADLWTGPEFDGDSLTGVFSASKGAAALVIALLVQNGTLDLDQRVSHYWPEFAAGGKRDVLLRDVMSHRAGLVGADSGFTLEELADDRAIARRLESQRPYWRPGATFGYHALVVAALSGEVVRRATGVTMQDSFARLVRDARGVDFFLGLPDSQEYRYREVQPMIETPERLAALAARATSPNSLTGIAFNRNHPENRDLWSLPNMRAVRALGPASYGGVASARGLARMYAAAISSVDGMAPLLTPETALAFGQIQSIGYDSVLREHKAFAVGFSATSEVYPMLGQGAFGHSGAGGQLGFADPRTGLAYGYNRRRFAFPPGGAAPENNRLVGAVYAALSELL
jgi:CubicO group peptidase (beta-lactamase class C family)